MFPMKKSKIHASILSFVVTIEFIKKKYIYIYIYLTQNANYTYLNYLDPSFT